MRLSNRDSIVFYLLFVHILRDTYTRYISIQFLLIVLYKHAIYFLCLFSSNFELNIFEGTYVTSFFSTWLLFYLSSQVYTLDTDKVFLGIKILLFRMNYV